MIRAVKRTALTALRTAGFFGLASRSRWRNERLLILGYHGIAQEDEHQWDPSLFIAPEHLACRLRYLRAAGFHILPLGEALTKLNEGTLPARSVAITFDDGFVNFYRLALPILREYDAPATVYLTTYYSENNLPVPGVTAGYMLWKSRDFTGRIASVPRFKGTLSSDWRQRLEVSYAIGRYFTNERTLTAAEKHRMIEALAEEVGFDLESLVRRRIMHLMTPDEARDVSRAGIDIQLHTHRHWLPPDERLVGCEITDNRNRIHAFTGKHANDFCYPNGVFYPELLSWLRSLGIRSATTCERGLASKRDDPLLLPRFLDHSNVSPLEFEAWASGVASVLPRRHGVRIGRPMAQALCRDGTA